MHMSSKSHILITYEHTEPLSLWKSSSITNFNDWLLNDPKPKIRSWSYLIFKPPWIDVLQLFIILKTIKLNINWWSLNMKMIIKPYDYRKREQIKQNQDKSKPGREEPN